jgi:hypothetical protein
MAVGTLALGTVDTNPQRLHRARRPASSSATWSLTPHCAHAKEIIVGPQ